MNDNDTNNNDNENNNDNNDNNKNHNDNNKRKKWSWQMSVIILLLKVIISNDKNNDIIIIHPADHTAQYNIIMINIKFYCTKILKPFMLWCMMIIVTTKLSSEYIT